MRSDADTVEGYLAGLPEQRRQLVETVRQVILRHLPAGYEEAMNWGMISYQVPLATYPDTHNGQPLMYAALASQKRYISLYLTPIYMDDEARQAFEAQYRATGKRYDVGKSCVRFRKLEDLPLGLVAEAISQLSVEEFIAKVESVRAGRKRKKST